MNRTILAGWLCLALLLIGIGGKSVTVSLAEPAALVFVRKSVPGVDVVVKKSPGNTTANNRMSGPDGTATINGLEPGGYIVTFKLPGVPAEKAPQKLPAGSRGPSKIPASAQGSTLSFRGVKYQISIGGLPIDANKAALYPIGNAATGGGYEFECFVEVKSAPSRALTVKIEYDFPDGGQPAETRKNGD